MIPEQTLIACRDITDKAGFSDDVQNIFCELINDICVNLNEDLTSIILYGSAAEGKMRLTSDINLLVVLKKFPREKVDVFRENLRLAKTITDIKVMFILYDEIEEAAEAFAIKFSDIIHRHIVIFGSDPIQNLSISRDAKIRRLQQVILNLTIRLRERYAIVSLREEQLALVLADITGPLRVAAANILEIQGNPAASIKEALEIISSTLEVDNWQQALSTLSTIRETRMLAPGSASETCFTIMEILRGMQKMAAGL
jgi:predicted nucleotidyltransferase